MLLKTCNDLKDKKNVGKKLNSVVILCNFTKYFKIGSIITSLLYYISYSCSLKLEGLPNLPPSLLAPELPCKKL